MHELYFLFFSFFKKVPSDKGALWFQQAPKGLGARAPLPIGSFLKETQTAVCSSVRGQGRTAARQDQRSQRSASLVFKFHHPPPAPLSRGLQQVCLRKKRGGGRR